MDEALVVLRTSAPLLFAVLGAHVFARIRLFNVSLESVISAGAISFTLAWVWASAYLGWPGWPGFFFAVFVALCIGSLLGGAFGVLVVVFGLDGVMASLALSMIIVGSLSWIGTAVLPGVALSATAVFLSVDLPSLVWWLVVGVWASGLFLAAFLRLNTLGRHVFAVGLDADGEEAGRQVGLPVGLLKIWSSVVGGAIVAFAGVVVAIMATGAVDSSVASGRGFLAIALTLLWRRSLAAACISAVVVAWFDLPAARHLAATIGISPFDVPGVVAALPYWGLLLILTVPGVIQLTKAGASRMWGKVEVGRRRRE